MKVYTFSEARQKLASLLDKARQDGQVRIRRRDGQEFLVEPAPAAKGSPFDIHGLDLGIGVPQLLSVVRDSRRSTERFVRKIRKQARRSRRRPRGK